jgi:excinuclease ABC subunit C
MPALERPALNHQNSPRKSRFHVIPGRDLLDRVMDSEKQQQLMDNLPTSPGVYIMKGVHGKILYVGKAKNLKSRVRSYFSDHSSDTRYIARNVRRLVADVEIVLTGTEKEALLLENTLIKTHRPRFNIKLRDDKDYLCLRLDQSAEWPHLEIVRRPQKDGALYFGPYHSASRARETLKLVERSFKLRSCKDSYMKNRSRPCIQHQMHRCLAPCVLDVDREEYLNQVGFVRLFLRGKKADLIEELKEKMHTASSRFAYEQAAVYRDQIEAVKATLSPQQVVVPGGIDQDLVGMHREGDRIQIVVLEIRSGQLGERHELYETDQEFPDDEIMSSFLVQRYLGDVVIPQEIIISRNLGETRDTIQEILSEKRGKRTQIIFPHRGKRINQIEMADLNAKQLITTRLKETDQVEARLAAVQRRLRLPTLPHRIECVDISHLSGTGTVGAISAMIDGKITRNAGRTYRIKTATQGDDFMAMKEVLTRRFIRAKAGNSGWESPDLLVVDGGRGQLSVAVAVLAELEMPRQPVVALAKARDEQQDAQTDRIFMPGRKNPIHLKTRITALHLLAEVRDEAHRMAVGYQRRLRRRERLISELDGIAGVGPKTRTLLLKTFGSVKRIREATEAELIEVPGIGAETAKRILEGLAF